MTRVLASFGIATAGPFTSRTSVLEWLDDNETPIHGALLATTLNNGDTFALADMLVRRNIPVVFMTRDSETIPWNWHEAPVIRMPYCPADVGNAVLPLVSAPLRLTLPEFSLATSLSR